MTVYNEDEMRELICEIGRRMYDKNFVVSNDGNISVRISEDEVLCTPTGVSKGFMTQDMICKVNLDGETLQDNGVNKPSSEVKMHLRVYKERPDVRAVVHSHPPFSTAYAVMNMPLDRPLIPESVIHLGVVPVAEYGTPSTDEIPNAVSKYLQKTDTLLLENHGALTYGPDLMTAYHRTESLEFYAKIIFLCDMLGLKDQNMLDDNQLKTLYEIRDRMQIPGKFMKV